jgi:D-xylose transport system permease protein
VLFLVLLAGGDVVMRRTRLGRHAVAIGSNAAAARRAGIAVDRIRMVVFALASVLAVAGGILASSRLLAVNQSSGSTDLMLTAVAAAVIGGTSLFGGRGSVWSALLGSLVVGSLANGLDLLGASSAIRLIATGLVLAAAVGLDTLARRAEPHSRA